MKAHAYLLPGLIAAAQTAAAAVIAYDSFETVASGNSTAPTYVVARTNGTTFSDGRIFSQSPTASNTGFTGSWTHSSGTTSTSDIRVQTTGLTHGLLATTPSAGSLHFTSGNNLRNVGRAFDATAIAAISSASTLYLSGLLSVGSMPAISGASYFGLGQLPSLNGAITTGIFVGIGADGFRLSYNDESGAFTQTTVVGSSSLAINSAQLFQLAVDFDYSGSTDRITINVFGQDNLDPFAPDFTQTVDANINRDLLTHLVAGKTNLAAYGNNTDTPRFDEFRLGTGLSDVISVVPEPDSALLVAFSVGLAVTARRRNR